MIHPYLWIVVVGGFVCFLVACGNGANDLANAFGTSYGSRVLTLSQVIVVATVCEFAGAAGLGSKVATTMSSGIAKLSTFENDPYVLMYGMLCALGSSFIWLLYATLTDLTVSSHQAIAGGIIGFALAYGGADAVVWAGKKDEFPFVSGVVPIIISWFASPLLSGIAAILLYLMGRFLFLERAYAVRLAPYLMPVVVFVVFLLEFIFIFLNAASNHLHWTSAHASWMAVVVAVAAGILSLPLIPLLKRRIESLRQCGEERAAEEGLDPVEAMRCEMSGARVQHVRTFATKELAAEYRAAECLRRRNAKELAAAAKAGTTEEACTAKKLRGGERLVDGVVVPGDSSEDRDVEEEEEGNLMGGRAAGTVTDTEIDPNVNYLTYDASGVRLFDPRAEYIFRILQVVTAACTSLAHGSSDVSNSVGPFAAVYEIYQTGNVNSTTRVDVWLLCYGGAGIVVGLATFGLPIMKLLGEKLAVLTPVRGCAAEVATALVVSVASIFGIPVSSTQCITGAVVAISLVDVGYRRVHWKLVVKMYAGWLFTLITCGIVSACFFAQGITSPVKSSAS